MSYIMPAMKSKMGNNEYYIVTMSAMDLVKNTKIPKEMPGWDNLSLEEKEQRDINYNRVKKDMIHYLAGREDRFFGSVIVAVDGLERLKFTSLRDMKNCNLDDNYMTDGDAIGFLHFQGEEIYFPIDGQHRIKALEFALEGKDEKSKDIDGFRPSPEVAKDRITVIMIPKNDNKKLRSIFTSVNRYAKPTTTGQNLVVDDNDVVAILARKVTNDLISADLVNYKTNTLNDKNGYFITLSTIAKCTEHILTHISEERRIDRKKLPDPDTLSLYENETIATWEFLLEGIGKFSDGLADKSGSGDEVRKELKRDYLLMRPLGFVVLFGAYLKAIHEDVITPQEAVSRLNSVDWSFDSALWKTLLWSSNKIQTKNEALAIEILTYVISDNYPSDQKELLEKYLELFPPDERPTGLPKKVKQADQG